MVFPRWRRYTVPGDLHEDGRYAEDRCEKVIEFNLCVFNCHLSQAYSEHFECSAFKLVIPARCFHLLHARTYCQIELCLNADYKLRKGYRYVLVKWSLCSQRSLQVDLIKYFCNKLQLFCIDPAARIKWMVTLDTTVWRWRTAVKEHLFEIILIVVLWWQLKGFIIQTRSVFVVFPFFDSPSLFQTSWKRSVQKQQKKKARDSVNKKGKRDEGRQQRKGDEMAADSRFTSKWLPKRRSLRVHLGDHEHIIILTFTFAEVYSPVVRRRHDEASFISGYRPSQLCTVPLHMHYLATERHSTSASELRPHNYIHREERRQGKGTAQTHTGYNGVVTLTGLDRGAAHPGFSSLGLP